MAEIHLHPRAVSSIAPAEIASPFTRAPAGISSKSSIASSTAEGFAPQTRPILASPMYEIINTHRETERLTAKSARLFETDTTRTLQEIDELSTERAAELRKEAEAAKARGSWSTLSTIAEYIAGIGFLLLGTALTATPAGFVSGVSLIASSVIGLGIKTLHDTHLLHSAIELFTKSEELQKKIAQKIEMGAFFLQMGLGLAGGIGAWKTGALAAARINGSITYQTISSAMTGANQALSITGRIGSTHYQKKMAYSQARLQEIETTKVITEQELQQETKQLVKMIESTQSQTDQAHQAIRALQVSQD